MPPRTRKKAPKSKWARKVNRKPKRKPRFKLGKKQQAMFDHLMGGGSLDESE
jgi:hypothetical protein